MKNIVVVGVGIMGNGIVYVFVQNGFQVIVIDILVMVLEKVLFIIICNLDCFFSKECILEDDKMVILDCLSISIDMKVVVVNVDLVVEVVIENVDLKLKIFQQLDEVVLEGVVLVINIFFIFIIKIVVVIKCLEKVIGMYFMNFVLIMKLVEVICGYVILDEVMVQIMELFKQLGKVLVEVNDYLGFVVNCILMFMINEVIYLLYEGVVGVLEIDMVMKLGMVYLMGLLQLVDFIGFDVCLLILCVLYDGFGNFKYVLCLLLVNMVMVGKLGVKLGEGFYIYGYGIKEFIVVLFFVVK